MNQMKLMDPKTAEAIPSAVVVVYACSRAIEANGKRSTHVFTTTNKREAEKPDVTVFGSHICQIFSGVYQHIEFPDVAERIAVAELNGSFRQEG